VRTRRMQPIGATAILGGRILSGPEQLGKSMWDFMFSKGSGTFRFVFPLWLRVDLQAKIRIFKCPCPCPRPYHYPCQCPCLFTCSCNMHMNTNMNMNKNMNTDTDTDMDMNMDVEMYMDIDVDMEMDLNILKSKNEFKTFCRYNFLRCQIKTPNVRCRLSPVVGEVPTKRSSNHDPMIRHCRIIRRFGS
jgi:hypothetical protein